MSTQTLAGEKTTAVSLPAPLFAETVPIASPSLPRSADLLRLIEAVLSRSQLTNAREVAHFEERAAAYLGVAHCVAVSSCTAGLMLTERMLDLSGEVILPSFTFFATGHSLLWNNLQPVFADCDAHSFNIDPQKVEDAVTPRTSAILGVHIYGCPVAAGELEDIARRHGIRLIFDAAHAFGSQIDGRSVASFGDASVFSLTPTKPLVAGEGGLIATGDPELARRLRQARNYGKGESYDCDMLGLNARMTEIQATIAAAGLPRVERGVWSRNELALLYEGRLGAVPGIALQRIEPSMRSSRKDFAIVVRQREYGLSRDELEEALTHDNIETRRYFDPPLHRQKLYRSFAPSSGSSSGKALAVTENLSASVLCLPLHCKLPAAAVEAIADRIVELGGRASA